jgi:LysM repeat protein
MADKMLPVSDATAAQLYKLVPGLEEAPIEEKVACLCRHLREIVRRDREDKLALSRLELHNFNADEPRDGRGRWTTADEDAAQGGNATSRSGNTGPATTRSNGTTQSATQPAIPDTYVVRPGDTLWGIAKRLTGSGRNSNLLPTIHPSDPQRINPGDRIPLPETFKQKMRDFQAENSTTQAITRPTTTQRSAQPTTTRATTQPVTEPVIPDTYVVRPGDTLWGIAKRLTGSGRNSNLLPIIHPDDPNRLALGDRISLPDAFKQKMREFQAQTATTQPTTAPAIRPSGNRATSENIEELARVLMSEASVGNEQEREAVGNTILNRMQRNHTNKVADITGYGAYDRTQAPTPEMRALATRLLNGEVADNTNGATHFYSPDGMKKDANQQPTAPNWASEYPERHVDGARDAKFRFYRQQGDGPVR